MHLSRYTGSECPCWLIKSYYMNSLVTTWVFEAYMLSKATVGWSIAYYMSSLHTTWLFEHIYWIWMSLMVDLGVLHETHYTTWVFEAYAVKGICWLDGWYYTISFILHGLFARVYWNWMPLMVDLRVLHETHYTTWAFCTCIVEMNASDGWSRGTTWNAFY